MRKKILKNINSNLDKFLPSNPTIVFGFSGGADSVVLLHLLLKSIKKNKLLFVILTIILEENFLIETISLLRIFVIKMGSNCFIRKKI